MSATLSSYTLEDNMDYLVIKKFALKTFLWIGGKVFSKVESWLYSDDNLRHDIIIEPRDISYYNGDGVPLVSTYLDVQNKTPYSSVIIYPAILDVNHFIKMHGEFSFIPNEKTALRFESILTEAQVKKLSSINSEQVSNKNRGSLYINVSIFAECGKRKVSKGLTFYAIKIEGI
jgi:hypothetical protein